MSKRKEKLFLKLARNKQSKFYIEVKNQIRRAAPQLGGSFTTHDYLHGKNNWADIYFLSNTKPRFYNVSLDTTQCAFKGAVIDLAFDQSYELVPQREPRFLESGYKDPATGNYIITAKPPVRYPEFAGQSRMEWVERQLEPITNEGIIEVHEQWFLHNDYVYGIGLHVTLDVPYLTLEVIQDFIELFLCKEEAFRNPNPVSYRYDDIENWWGLDANAVAYPWEWREP